MNTKNILYGAGIMMLFLTSCDKEENLTPSGIKENYFAVPEDAMDEESVLRRNFYEQEKVYLLFNDTLRHEKTGIDRNGNTVYFTETVDLSYQMTVSTSSKYTFNYIPTLEKKQEFTTFILNKVLESLPEQLYPYSLLLVDSIKRYEKNTQTGTYAFYAYESLIIGSRCTAIARNDFDKMSATEKEDFGLTLKAQILASIIDVSEYTIFDNYGISYWNWPLTSKPMVGDVREVGFLKPYYYGTRAYFPSRELDRQHYIELYLSKTEAEILKEYAEYPIVLEKYALIKEIMANVGFTN